MASQDDVVRQDKINTAIEGIREVFKVRQAEIEARITAEFSEARVALQRVLPKYVPPSSMLVPVKVLASDISVFAQAERIRLVGGSHVGEEGSDSCVVHNFLVLRVRSCGYQL